MKRKKFLSVLLAMLMLLSAVTTGIVAMADDAAAEPQFYIVNATAGENGQIAPSGDRSVAVGGSDEFLITANAGYVIDKLTVNDEEVAEAAGQATYTYVITPNSDAKVYVTFREAQWFIVSVTCGEHGDIGATGDMSVREGDSHTFEIAANEGYVIDKLTVNDAEVAEAAGLAAFTYVLTPDSDTKVAVTFRELNRYVVSASGGENGQIAPAGDVSVLEGTSQAFEIAANDGYVIDKLTVNDVEIAEAAGQATYTYECTPNADAKVYVTFVEAAPEFYIVKATSGENGQIAPAGDWSIAAGESYTFAITANEGYVIDTLTVNGQEVAEAAGQTSYDYEMTPSADATIYVTFVEAAPEYYIVKATSGENGQIAPAGDWSIAAGESYTFAITANEGYVIDTLTVDGQEVAEAAGQASYDYEMTPSADATIYVTFVEATPEYYIVKATSGENGQIAPAGDWSIAAGESYTFAITANEGYVIDTLTVDGQEVEEAAGQTSYDYEMTPSADATIYVTFTEATPAYYIVSVAAGENGTITPSGDVSVNVGESETFVIEATDGYVIDKLTVNDQEVAEATGLTTYEYTITPDSDAKVYVTFKEAPPTEYTVSVTAGANGTVSPDGEVTVAAGESQTFAITADAGYVIDSLTVNGETYTAAIGQNAYQFTMAIEKDTDVQVTFRLVTTAQVMVSSAVLKASADDFSNTVQKLSVNDQLNVLGEEGNWYLVEYVKDGTTYTGYVEKVFVRIVAGDLKDKGVIVAKSADIYTDASSSSKVACTLNRNLLVYLDGEVGNYYLVSFSYAGTWYYGYVSKDYVRDNSLGTDYVVTWSANQALVMTDEVVVRDANGNPVTVLYEGNKVYINGSADGVYAVSFTLNGEPYEGYVASQYFKVVAGTAKDKGVIVAATANVYTATDMSKVETTLKRGQLAYIDAEADDYYLVSFTLNGVWHYGYVLKDYVRDNSLPTNYVVDRDNLMGVGTVTAKEIIVRDAMDEDSAPVTVLTTNNRVYINGEDGDWYKVSFTLGGEPYDGYVLKTDVKL